MKKIVAQKIKIGDNITNIGLVEKVELFDVAQLINVTAKGDILSAKFFWFRYNTLVTLE